MEILNNLEHGSFDEFNASLVTDRNMTLLKHINLTELYEFAMLECEEYFTENW